MSKVWNETLWDTLNPHVYNFNKFNFDFLKSFVDFIKRRCKIEETYCKDLKKLCQEFRPKDYTSKEYVRFSVQAAFDAVLTELNAMLEQRDKLLTQNLREIQKDLQEDLSKLRSDNAKVERKISEQTRALEAGRKRVFSARGMYHRAHADLAKTTTPEALEQRRQLCSTRRTAYTEALSEFNNMQRSHYRSDLPEQINRLEIVQRNFCSLSRLGMERCAKAEEASLTAQLGSVTSMVAAVGRVDSQADAEAFLRVTASGRPLPEALTIEEPTSSGPNALAPKAPTESEEKQKREREIGGPQKLLEAYKANPGLGDIASDQHDKSSTAGPPKRDFADEFLTDDYAYLVYSTVDGQDQTASAATASKAAPEMSAASAEATTAEALTEPKDVRASASAVVDAPSCSVVVVLYDFKDTGQPSTLPVSAGERVQLLHSDTEWSQVARLDGSERGYVPTAYISDAPHE